MDNLFDNSPDTHNFTWNNVLELLKQNAPYVYQKLILRLAQKNYLSSEQKTPHDKVM